MLSTGPRQVLCYKIIPYLLPHSTLLTNVNKKLQECVQMWEGLKFELTWCSFKTQTFPPIKITRKTSLIFLSNSMLLMIFFKSSFDIFQQSCHCWNKFISIDIFQGERRHWAVYYTSPQSFSITFSYSFAEQLWIEFWFSKLSKRFNQ